MIQHVRTRILRKNSLTRRASDTARKVCRTFCGLLAATAAAVGAVPAHAGIGVDLDTDRQTITDEIGSGGAWQAGDRLLPNILCPTGQVVTGWRFQNLPEGMANGIQGFCKKVNTNGTLTDVSGTTRAIRTLSGSGVATATFTECPNNGVMVGWKPYLYRYNAATQTVAGAEIYCAALTTSTTGLVTVDAGKPENRVVGKIDTGIAGNAASCPAGTIAVGFTGFTRQSYNSVKLLCSPLKVPSFTTNLAVTPPPISGTPFGLNPVNSPTFSTEAFAGGVRTTPAVRSFAPGVPSALKSTFTVSTNNAVANGGNARVLTLTARDEFNKPTVNATYRFAATPDVKLGTSETGKAHLCSTDATGTCTVSAVAIRAGSYATTVFAGSIELGTFNYAFVPGNANASSSGVRVVSDGVTGDGGSQAVLEALVRDTYGNPVAAGSIVNFAAAGPGVAFNGGPRGADGSCTTVGSTGACRVTVTSTQVGGPLTTVVTVGGNVFSGAFSADGATYGASPLTFRFRSAFEIHWVSPVQTGKNSTIQVYNAAARNMVFGFSSTNPNLKVNAASCNTNASASLNCAAPGPFASMFAGDCAHACHITVDSKVPGVYNVDVTGAGGAQVATITVVAGPAAAAKSLLSASTNGQTADGSSRDILKASVRDQYDNVMAGATVTFGGAGALQLNDGQAGAAGTCTTGSDGTCTVYATTTVAASYSSAVTVNGTAIGSVGFDFVPGSASPARSGARVVTDNVLANGTSLDVLEVLVRDAYDNPVAANTAVAFASPGSGVAFNGGARGSAGSCATSGTTGICQVSASSSDAGGGSFSSVVSVGGVAVSGSITVGSASYGPSPIVFAFKPTVPRLQIVKQVTNGTGSHAFSFELTGLQSTRDTITVAGAGSASGATLAGVDPARPITITEVASSDWPEAPVSASCVDLASATPAATFGTLEGYRLTIPLANTGVGANLRCTFVNARGALVSGRVFNDDGAGAGTANDGIANGAEYGLSGVAVSIGNCAATLHATTLTDAAGGFVLALPASVTAGASLCLDSATAAGRTSTGASAAGMALAPNVATTAGTTAFTYTRFAGSQRIAFTWPAGSGVSISGLGLASVPGGSLAQSQFKTGVAGSTVPYAHVYSAGTAGSLSFAVLPSGSASPTSGWGQKVYADSGCTGQLQPGAALLYPPAAPLAVVAGQIVCLVMQESIPADAVPGERRGSTLRATLAFANASPALSATYEVDDVTTVSSLGLALAKEVRNLSRGATAAFGTANRAQPGDTLEYRITYTNNASTTIHNLRINDSTPGYTTFRSASAGALPLSLTACAKRTPADGNAAGCTASQAAGGTGALEWQFTGELVPGASGVVTFQVNVD